jgi:hypothetical protein
MKKGFYSPLIALIAIIAIAGLLLSMNAVKAEQKSNAFLSSARNIDATFFKARYLTDKAIADVVYKEAQSSCNNNMAELDSDPFEIKLAEVIDVKFNKGNFLTCSYSIEDVSGTGAGDVTIEVTLRCGSPGDNSIGIQKTFEFKKRVSTSFGPETCEVDVFDNEGNYYDIKES